MAMEKRAYGKMLTYLCAFAMSVSVSGCIKVINNPLPVNKDINIPAGFDWKTVKEVTCNVGVISVEGIPDNMSRIIRIYSNKKMGDNSLLASGTSTPSKPFQKSISLASAVPKLYIQEIVPDGSINVMEADVTGNILNINFINTISAEGAYMSKSAPIPQNVVAIVDKDGDGVSATFDIDDNDPTVAFESYFPSAGTWCTYVYEDLWPQKGDYDVNDIVIGLHYITYTNSSNQVTKIRVNYNVRGSGSTYNLGVAFQLDQVSATSVKSVTGQTLQGSNPFDINSNGTEKNVERAIIPMFNNQRSTAGYSGFLNTVNGSYVDTPDNSVLVTFTSPMSQSLVSMESFNLFIVVNSRGCEVHIPSFGATSKFNLNLATGSILYPGNPFKYADGMMWGIMIPDYFKYPSERNSMLKAYPRFKGWAESGGMINLDWYRHDLQDNIVMDFIYIPQPSSVTTPSVTTLDVFDVTTDKAKCSAQVTGDGGSSVYARGICWATSPNPTISNNVISEGTGTGDFTCQLSGLNSGTTYYARAFATNTKGTSYGQQKSFTTILVSSAPTYPGQTLLPVKIANVWWAPVNAGYSSTRLYGLLYQWGRMYGQRGSFDSGGSFSNASAPVSLAVGNSPANADVFFMGLEDWCSETYDTWNLTLYNPCPSGWRVPTSQELSALIASGSTWVNAGSGSPDGLAGRWFGPDSDGLRTNSIFLPAGGFRNIQSLLSNRGTAGYYWPSNKDNDGATRDLYFTITNPGQRFSRNKVNGYHIRCVK